MKVEQFVMAYEAEQDRLRAILPEDFVSLRPDASCISNGSKDGISERKIYRGKCRKNPMPAGTWNL